MSAAVAAKLRAAADTVEAETVDEGAGPHPLAGLPEAMRAWADELNVLVNQRPDVRHRRPAAKGRHHF